LQHGVLWHARLAVTIIMALACTWVPSRDVFAFEPPVDASLAQQWALREVAAQEAWRRAQTLLGTAVATPIVVAVIDTGADLAHSELDGRLLPGHSFVAGSAAMTDGSPGGHGTAVAGIIAAASGPFPVRILPLQALDADASGDPDDAAAAVRWALAWRGAARERVRVINLSFGARMNAPPEALAEAIADATAEGILVVAAAGNDGGPVAGYYPAALPGVVSVGSSRPDHTLEQTSGEGAAIAAPGVGILTTLPGESYGVRSGTSFAAPLVSAAAALLWSVFPEQRRADIVDAILGGQANLPCNEPGRTECLVLSLDLALVRITALKAPVLDRPSTPVSHVAVDIAGTAAPGAEVTVRGSHGGAGRLRNRLCGIRGCRRRACSAGR